MSEAVAINGDCETSAAAGWTAGAIAYTDAAKISCGGTKVILQATCTFTKPANPPDVVTLTPGATKLKDNGSNVLREGDSTTSVPGNTLKVKDGINNKLWSA